MSGPIQMLMIKFDTTEKFTGEALKELNLLRGKGLIRLIDLLVVVKKPDGKIQRMEMTDLTDAQMHQFGSVVSKLMGLDGDTAVSESPLVVAGTQFGLSAEDLARLPDLLEPNTAAGLMLFEHTWAAGFQAAIARAGGHMTAQGFLTPQLLMKVGKEIQAIEEAEIAIELAEAVKGAAMLDALLTLAEVEAVEEAALEEAAAVVAISQAVQETAVQAEMFKAAIAADVVRTLVIAGMIEDAAVTEALDVLVAAHLIEEAAIAEANQAVAQMEVEVATAKAALAANP
ncbi:MAG: hypothetical protein BroJett015_08170 [Chloroflexota bacterium]|nr:hypothetical protein [Ardenticatenaceae bacterium]GIK55154.1 MAG: hypothetical protein BroJett015_08170 [Chloroflexota bacterium]